MEETMQHKRTITQRIATGVLAVAMLLSTLAPTFGPVVYADDVSSIVTDGGGISTGTPEATSAPEPSAIPEREMNIFILVTSSGEKGLEYLGDDRTEFYVGEPVRVIDGPFKGAEGYIRRIKGNRRLIVTVQGICAVATSYIPQCFLQKIHEEAK